MMRALGRSAAAIAVTCLLCMSSGCAPDLRDEFPFDGETAHGERVTNEDLGGGVTKTTVDSSDKAAWVYLDLDATPVKELPVSEALDTQSWDLQLQRFKIYSNSGAHGAGGVGVAVLPGADFDALTAPPEESTFQSDVDDPSSENDSAFLAGDGWYAYDLLEHKLKARDTVYVVRTTEGAYFKLQLLGYYSSSGDAGHVSFKWAKL